jgi:hypothetical protein
MLGCQGKYASLACLLSLLALATLGCTADRGHPSATSTDDSGADPAGDPDVNCRAGSFGGDLDPPLTSFALLEACVTGIPPNGRVVEYLNFTSADGALELRVARRWIEGSAVGETFVLELAGFALNDHGSTVCITCPAHLGYAYSHHNWQDQATAVVADTEYMLTMVFNLVGPGSWTDDLTAVRISAGSQLWGPVPLVAVSCATDPPGDANFCVMRPRID